MSRTQVWRRPKLSCAHTSSSRVGSRRCQLPRRRSRAVGAGLSQVSGTQGEATFGALGNNKYIICDMSSRCLNYAQQGSAGVACSAHACVCTLLLYPLLSPLCSWCGAGARVCTGHKNQQAASSAHYFVVTRACFPGDVFYWGGGAISERPFVPNFQ